MNSFSPRSNGITKMEILVNLGLYKLLLIRIEPRLLNIGYFFQITKSKLLLKLLNVAIKGLLILQGYNHMLGIIEGLPVL